MAEAELVYKKPSQYSLAVPLLGQFIQRQRSSENVLESFGMKEPAR
jgi:hypothetical protein